MRRLLVVEDDRDLLPLLKHVLLAGGYAVDVADTVAGALAMLDEHPYDLVLADWRLEDGTGMTIVKRAAELGAKPLIITGYAFEMPKNELEQFEYLLKPVRPGELLGVIERMLGACEIR